MPLHAPNGGQPSGQVGRFYRDALEVLDAEGLRFLIGGGYALEIYTGLRRRTKDLDIYVLPQDVKEILRAFNRRGFRTECTDAEWLAKIREDDEFIDIIFDHNNRSCPVDEAWFTYSQPIHVLDVKCLLCPCEELIWHKAFIMGRHRYDGPDVAHLIHARAEQLDWQRLLGRFGDWWPVLYSHLILFGFIYPSARHRIPNWLIEELTARHQEAWGQPLPAVEGACAGRLLSAHDYLADVELWGMRDLRPQRTK